MATRDTIVIGASAGGVQALSQLVGGGLSPNIPAAIFRCPVPLGCAMSVMQDIRVDHSLPLREIASLLNEISHQQVDDDRRYPVPDQVEIEAKIAEQEMEGDELIASVERLGKISKLTCPDCHGALWEINDTDILATAVTSDTLIQRKL